MISCAQSSSRINPEWNISVAKHRKESHPLPEIYIIYNDHQLGWLYNQNGRMSDDEFREYVQKIVRKFTRPCKVKYFYKVGMLRDRFINYAVIYF